MGIRGELFSTKVSCEGRTYFFNVKQNRMGDVFLSIVESKPTEAESFDRRSIVVFREDMRGFLKAFQTTLSFIEKPGSKPTEMIFEPEDEPAPRARRPRPTASGAEAEKAADRDGSGAVPRAKAGGRGAGAATGGTAAATGSAAAATGSAEGGTGEGSPKKRRIVVRKKPAAGEPK